jgi:uncharacterized protein DUF5753/helix-turn-helix protein
VTDHKSTVRSRYLGRELLRAAQRNGHNADDMAEMLAWHPSTVSHLLSGTRMANTEDVSAFLALCGVIGVRRADLLELVEHCHELLWWHDYGTRPPVHNQALTDNEDRAVHITSFGDTLVPDLLQVPGYTRALLAAQPTVPDTEVDERVTETQRRQRILDREFSPPHLRMFVTEYALTRTGAGDAAMADQAHHLLRLAARPEITIRVLPEEGDIRNIAPFTLLEFHEHQPVVYLEYDTVTAFLERPQTIAAYHTVITDLDEHALDNATSHAHIAEIAKRRAHQAKATPTRLADDSMPRATSLTIWAH